MIYSVYIILVRLKLQKKLINIYIPLPSIVLNLFTGISEYLLDSYSDKLKSDYLQVAHHGNNGFSDEFYETVNPKVAFFPSPTVTMENVNNVSWYSTEYLSELLGNIGATIYTFKDSPAEIVMK